MADEKESGVWSKITQKAQELLGGESAAEKAEREARVALEEENKRKAIEGIKKTQQKRGEKIKTYNKEIKGVDREIAELETQRIALEKEHSELQKASSSSKESVLSQTQALDKKLAELNKKKQGLSGERQELIDFNKNKKSGGQKSNAKDANVETKEETAKPQVAETTNKEASQSAANSNKEGVKMDKVENNGANVENKGTSSAEQKNSNAETAKTEAAGEAKTKIDNVYEKASKGELLKEHQVVKDGVNLGEQYNGLKSDIDSTKKAIQEATKGGAAAPEELTKKLKALEDDFEKVKKPVVDAKAEVFKKELGAVDRLKARFAGTFGEVGGSKGAKAMKGAGVVVGLGAMVDGTRRIIAPERDENGERKGSVWSAIGEAGLGAGAIALALKGGHNRAMGI